ncbi:MAG TPA: DUF2231 domain-containing protein [Ktedonobacterales bacterium]|nr:DUF2231 domain-containing protein [Ktedonobacterales bacterium]
MSEIKEIPPAATPEPPVARVPFSERLYDGTQHLIAGLVGARRKPPRLFKSLLNGTWLGHPLHPLLTDVPVAAWVLTGLFDIIWLIAPATNAWAARAAEVTVLAGLVGAAGAIATGLTDWSDTYGRERSVGFLHGLFNIIAFGLYLASAILRFTLAASGETLLGAVLGFIGLAVMAYAAYLGGDMVFTQGTGVNHTAWEPAGDDFEPVMPLAEIAENQLYRVMAAGAPAVLLRSGDRVYAIGATCPHAGGPLDEGPLRGTVVECPWHASRFRMTDGKVLTGPATVNAARYEVRIHEGQVEIKRRATH